MSTDRFDVRRPRKLWPEVLAPVPGPGRLLFPLVVALVVVLTMLEIMRFG